MQNPNSMAKGSWENLFKKLNRSTYLKGFALFGAIFFLILIFTLAFKDSIVGNTSAFFTKSVTADTVVIETVNESNN